MDEISAASPPTSIWIKTIAVCAVLIVLFFAYSALSASKNEQCRINAMQPLSLIQVLDTKWTTAGCQYLIKHKYTDSAPSWEPQYLLDTYSESEREATTP